MHVKYYKQSCKTDQTSISLEKHECFQKELNMIAEKMISGGVKKVCSKPEKTSKFYQEYH